MFTNGPLHESAMIWRFCLAALVVWRMTHLLAEEDGPRDAIAKLRARIEAIDRMDRNDRPK